MLCQACEEAIRRAAKTVAQIKDKPSSEEIWLAASFLHPSLRVFRQSIAAGCYLCRSLEELLRNAAELQGPNEHNLRASSPSRIVGNIMTRVGKWTIQHTILPCAIYTGTNMSMKFLDSAQQWCSRRYLFQVYYGPWGMPAYPITAYHGPSLNFALCPVLSGSSSVDSDFDARLRTRHAWTGDSTNLWNYWLNICLETHARCRAIEQRLQPFSPKRLVELLLDDHGRLFMWRLVCSSTTGVVPYFTLSHCWGTSQPIHLTKDNSSLLWNSSSVHELPKTYQDALSIVNSMNYKYIWIYSLCIVQDDEEDWEIESSQMGLIYHHAVCNIAATWASNGGEGCFGTRDPTMVTPTFITLRSKVDGSSTCQFSRDYVSRYNEDITEAPLGKRGWVVQERYLARRQLNCTKRQLYWECHELLASEEFPDGFPGDHPAKTDRRYTTLESLRKPCLNLNNGEQTRRDWAALVGHYSHCQLTRDTDKLVALSGLESRLQSTVDDVYVAGLWTKNLYQQMC